MRSEPADCDTSRTDVLTVGVVGDNVMSGGKQSVCLKECSTRPAGNTWIDHRDVRLTLLVTAVCQSA
jgi:hypothetical protein